MLSYLTVENLAVVSRSELDFAPGLNVFTGETGAGKSILIDAIQLLLNKRAPSGLIRSGSERLAVEALFSRGDEELCLRREVTGSKSLAFVDGTLAPIGQLLERAAARLTIYGQRDHVFLLDAANHQVYLDAFAGNGPLLAELAVVFRRLREAQAGLAALQAQGRQAAERLDYLRFQLQEIDGLGLSRGEEAVLLERQKLLSQAETIRARVDAMEQELYGADSSVYNTLARNRAHSEYLAGLFADFAPWHEELSRLAALIPEAMAQLQALTTGIECDPGELNDLEGRLGRINRLKARFKLGFDAVLDKADEMRLECGQLERLDISQEEKAREIETALNDYRRLHEELRRRRQEAGVNLADLIVKELVLLEMKKAVFEVRLGEVEPQPETVAETGCDRIEFYFSSNPGQPPGRLKEVASGGELSRLMLVLKSILREEAATTYIFDEIDAGIGGKTAEFVGEKLRRIAHDHQVICITHLPQIASFADRHFLISKEFRRGQTFSTAERLDEAGRVREIARMMAGSAVHEDVLRAASRLLEKNRA